MRRCHGSRSASAAGSMPGPAVGARPAGTTGADAYRLFWIFSGRARRRLAAGHGVCFSLALRDAAVAGNDPLRDGSGHRAPHDHQRSPLLVALTRAIWLP